MNKVWTFLFVAVLVVGGAFLVGCSSNSCDPCNTCGQCSSTCGCGAPVAPAPGGGGGSCGGGGGS